jgi:hypothetical protein
MSQDGGRVAGPSLKRRDAAGAAPAVSPFHSDHDVLIKETAVLQKPHRGFRRKFVGTKLADTDEIAQPLGFFRFGKIQEWIESMNFASGRWLSILSERFKLGFDKFTQGAIFKSFDDGAGSRSRHIEDASSRSQAAGLVNFAEQCGFFYGWTQQGKRPYRRSAHRVRRIEYAVPDAKP